MTQQKCSYVCVEISTIRGAFVYEIFIKTFIFRLILAGVDCCAVNVQYKPFYAYNGNQHTCVQLDWSSANRKQFSLRSYLLWLDHIHVWVTQFKEKNIHEKQNEEELERKQKFNERHNTNKSLRTDFAFFQPKVLAIKLNCRRFRIKTGIR